MDKLVFQSIPVTRRDQEFIDLVKHVRHLMEKRQRLVSFLWMRMVGRWE